MSNTEKSISKYYTGAAIAAAGAAADATTLLMVLLLLLLLCICMHPLSLVLWSDGGRGQDGTDGVVVALGLCIHKHEAERRLGEKTQNQAAIAQFRV